MPSDGRGVVAYPGVLSLRVSSAIDKQVLLKQEDQKHDVTTCRNATTSKVKTATISPNRYAVIIDRLVI